MKEVTPTDISRLIAAQILGQPLSETEQQQLDTWLQASVAHQALYNRIKCSQATSQIMQLEEQDYGQEMAERFRKQHFTHHLKHSRHRKTFYIWISSTVAVLLLILSVVLYPNKHPETKSIKKTSHIIQPGKTGAVLTLANGTSVQLDSNGNKNVEDVIDSVYTASSPSKNEPQEIIYHTLSIPAGEEYFCRLDDQTSVWLNSQTELRFPKTFSEEERKVYLKGEAFFDVTKDAEHPFIVSTEQGNITVYGTRFNVNNYAETPLSAVLVEGSIGFTTPQGKEVKIKPSERLTYEETNGKISVSTVDTSLYTAWVDHMFIFDGQPLEEIMITLARWYNFTVSFTSEDIRHIRLSGQLYRYEDIRILLDSYEQTTGLQFRIENRQIIITK